MNSTHFHASGRGRSRRQREAFSLPEVMFAVLIISILVVANMVAVSLSRVQTIKDQDRNIMLDYATHYLELIKGLPFSEVHAGAPVNALYDGSSGSLLITIPASTAWLSLNSANYQSFHPDLVWASPRNPEMRVECEAAKVAGVDHTKHIRVDLRWDSPLGLGNKLDLRMDMVRVRDL